MVQEFEWFDTNEIIPDLHEEDIDDEEVPYIYVSDPVLVWCEHDGVKWYGLATYEVDDMTHITEVNAGWVDEKDGMWIDDVKYWAYVDE